MDADVKITGIVTAGIIAVIAMIAVSVMVDSSIKSDRNAKLGAACLTAGGSWVLSTASEYQCISHATAPK